jgi:hypothetical protein
MPKITDFPAALLYALNTAVALFVSFGLPLSDDMVAAVSTIATAALAGYAALLVRPVAIGAFGAAAATALTAAVAFGLDWTPDQIGLTVASISIVLGFLTHQSVSPVGGELDRPVVRGSVSS